MDEISKCEAMVYGGKKNKSKPATSKKRSAAAATTTPPKRVSRVAAANVTLPPMPEETERATTTAVTIRSVFHVPESVSSQYMHMYNLSVVHTRDAPFPTEDDGSLIHVWNSWAFPFRSKILYGQLAIHGLSLPTKQEILAMRDVAHFLQLRFYPSPSEENLTFSNVAAYVRTQATSTLRPLCTDAVLLLVLWKLQLHDNVKWTHATAVDSLPIRARFVEVPYIFEKTLSTHPECRVAASWVRKVCAVAYTYFELSGKSPDWRVQFTGMNAYLCAAFDYFSAIRAFIGRSVLPCDTTTGHLFAAHRQVFSPDIDVTDASFAEMRLPVCAYMHDFSWLFACAYLLAYNSVDSRISLCRQHVLEYSWETIPVPQSPSSHLTTTPSQQTYLPDFYVDMLAVTAKSEALEALQWLCETTNVHG